MCFEPFIAKGIKVKKNSKLNFTLFIIGIAIVVLAVSILVPISILNLKNNNQEPIAHCEFVNLNNLKEVTVTNTNNQSVSNMYVTTSSINGKGEIDVSASIKNNSNVNTLLRVKIVSKLSNTNTNITNKNLLQINSSFKVNINNQNWILASDTFAIIEDNTSLNNISNIYIYYKGVVNKNVNIIEIFNKLIISTGSYNGYFPIFDLDCDILEANNTNALEWVSKSFNKLTGWEKTWYDSIKDHI